MYGSTGPQTIVSSLSSSSARMSILIACLHFSVVYKDTTSTKIEPTATARKSGEEGPGIAVDNKWTKSVINLVQLKKCKYIQYITAPRLLFIENILRCVFAKPFLENAIQFRKILRCGHCTASFTYFLSQLRRATTNAMHFWLITHQLSYIALSAATSGNSLAQEKPVIQT